MLLRWVCNDKYLAELQSENKEFVWLTQWKEYLAHYLIQSFSPETPTSEQVHEIGRKTALEFTGVIIICGGYSHR